MVKNENNLKEVMMKEVITNIIRTFQAVGPILGNALKSGQLFNPQCELTEPDPDILCEYDVNIPMSEGFSVTANIFRSKKAAEKGEKVPEGLHSEMILECGLRKSDLQNSGERNDNTYLSMCTRSYK